MTDYKERTVEEVKELRVKIAKLSDFIYENTDFELLDWSDKERLVIQLFHMNGYEKMLSERIMNW